ncbi:MAG: hypothetical protein ACSHX8_06515 [Opitutaceae bacterium]
MNRLYPLILIIVAGLCFYAGYTVGVKKVTYTKIVPQPVEVNAPAEVQAAVVAKVAEPAPSLVDPVVEAVVSDHEHSLRAAKRHITFTDDQNRELVVEVMEANEDSLKVRRVSDQRVVTLPTHMLCEEDQAFASYLHKQANPEPAVDLTQDELWDEMFK